jgi:hypothetical protein
VIGDGCTVAITGVLLIGLVPFTNTCRVVAGRDGGVGTHRCNKRAWLTCRGIRSSPDKIKIAIGGKAFRLADWRRQAGAVRPASGVACTAVDLRILTIAKVVGVIVAAENVEIVGIGYGCCAASCYVERSAARRPTRAYITAGCQLRADVDGGRWVSAAVQSSDYIHTVIPYGGTELCSGGGQAISCCSP